MGIGQVEDAGGVHELEEDDVSEARETISITYITARH